MLHTWWNITSSVMTGLAQVHLSLAFVWSFETFISVITHREETSHQHGSMVNCQVTIVPSSHASSKNLKEEETPFLALKLDKCIWGGKFNVFIYFTTSHRAQGVMRHNGRNMRLSSVTCSNSLDTNLQIKEVNLFLFIFVEHFLSKDCGNLLPFHTSLFSNSK